MPLRDKLFILWYSSFAAFLLIFSWKRKLFNCYALFLLLLFLQFFSDQKVFIPSSFLLFCFYYFCDKKPTQDIFYFFTSSFTDSQFRSTMRCLFCVAIFFFVYSIWFLTGFLTFDCNPICRITQKSVAQRRETLKTANDFHGISIETKLRTRCFSPTMIFFYSAIFQWAWKMENLRVQNFLSGNFSSVDFQLFSHLFSITWRSGKIHDWKCYFHYE